MKSVSPGPAVGVIPLRLTSQARRPCSDLAPGSSGEQSGGLTHWERVERQWNLTLHKAQNLVDEWLGGGSPFINMRKRHF